MRGSDRNQTGRRWFWLSAIAFGFIGALSVSGFDEAEPTFKAVILASHAAAVLVAVWGGRISILAGSFGVGSAALMAGISSWNKLSQQTQGFEWRFNNALGNAVECGANYLVLIVAVAVIAILGASKSQEVTNM